MTNFAQFKKTSQETLNRLAKEMKDVKSSTIQVDERLWQPEVDAVGNGYAVIRFLPAPKVDGDQALPWVKYYTHGFQGPTGLWYIQNSLTSIGMTDPVSEYNSKLWNSSNDKDSPARKQAQAQKRRLTIVSNVLILDDPKNPQNVGKIKLFKYGKKIYDKIDQAMHPQFQDEKPINPFDFWEGADFKIKIRNLDGYKNYDLSTFSSTPGPIQLNGKGLTDDDLQKIWETEYSLKEFLDPKNFKTYDQLKTQLDRVLGLNTISESIMLTEPSRPPPAAKSIVADDDEDMEFFKSLAEEDE